MVQKNLVFVVGITPRIADAELLKKGEYFGRFGKIHKVVVNCVSASSAGATAAGVSFLVVFTIFASRFMANLIIPLCRRRPAAPPQLTPPLLASPTAPT